MFDLSRIYLFAYRVGLRNLASLGGIRLLLEPSTYWRNLEVPETLRAINPQRGEKILDVGSPKLLSLYMAAKLGSALWATDLFPYFVDEYTEYSRQLALDGQYHIELQDARQLKYPDNFFDKIFSVSVIEHIEDLGDSAAVNEIARVLKPGGLFCLTVPVEHKYRDVFTGKKLYYKEHTDDKPVFLERHYDESALSSRLIAPSGLQVLQQVYYRERLPYEQFSKSLPKALKRVLAPFGFIASKLFLTRSSSLDERAKTALVLLRKS